MRLNANPFITAERIGLRLQELAQAISKDYGESEICLIVVLKGSMVFATDLMRELTVPATIEFIRAKSYDGTRPGGRVEFSYLPGQSLKDKHILVVEDIIDTGRTLAAILEWLRQQEPATLSVCALLDKPTRRESEVPIAYTGFVIDDHFVVGYGLDYRERGRELPNIHVLEPDEVSSEASPETS